MRKWYLIDKVGKYKFYACNLKKHKGFQVVHNEQQLNDSYLKDLDFLYRVKTINPRDGNFYGILSNTRDCQRDWSFIAGAYLFERNSFDPGDFPGCHNAQDAYDHLEVTGEFEEYVRHKNLDGIFGREA